MPIVVGNPESDTENAFLGIVEVEHPGEEQGSHFRNRRADRVAFLAKEIPEDDGKRLEAVLIRKAYRFGAFLQKVLGFAGD